LAATFAAVKWPYTKNVVHLVILVGRLGEEQMIGRQKDGLNFGWEMNGRRNWAAILGVYVYDEGKNWSYLEKEATNSGRQYVI
jgi:hypothetical protein